MYWAGSAGGAFLDEWCLNIKIITPAIPKSTRAITTSMIMSSVLLLPPLSEEPELLVPVVLWVVVVAVAVAEAVGEAVAEGLAVAGDVIAADVMARRFTPVV
jgi:hypothetical protein